MRPLRSLLVLLCATAALLIAPGVAQATLSVPSCSAPTANRWAGVAGSWSDAGKWSLGHVPTSTEHACLNVTRSLNPVLDVDIDVAGIVNANVLIPTGRRVTVNVATGTFVAAPGSVVTIAGGAGSGASGDLNGAGTLRVGPGADVRGMALRNSAGERTTLDADGTFSLGTMYLNGSLDLVDDSRIVSNNVTVRGSIQGDAGTSIEDPVIELGGLVSLAVIEVDLVTDEIHPLGDLVYRGDAQTIGGIFRITSSNRTVTLDNATVVASQILFFAPVVLSGGTRVTASSSIQNTFPLRLVSCELESPTIHASSSVRVSDLGCIDPPAGATRRFTFGHGATNGLILENGGTLDDGGTLWMTGYLTIPGGSTLTDGATLVQRGTVTISPSSPGIARVEHLFEGGVTSIGSVTLFAETAETLVLEAPPRSPAPSPPPCVNRSTTTGSGQIEIHEVEAFEDACVWTDVAGADGGRPVRYFTGGMPYEPRRPVVELNGGTWTPAGMGRVTMLAGHGIIDGSIVAATARPISQTLKVTGLATVDVLSVYIVSSLVTPGLLDLTSTSAQHVKAVVVDQQGVATLTAPFSRVVAPGILSPPTPTVSAGSIQSGFRLEVVSGTGELRLVSTSTTSQPPPPTVVTPPPALPTTTPPPTIVVPVVDPGPRPELPRALRLVGSARADVLRGGSGDDTIYGNVGKDALHGSDGKDVIDGGPDDDRLFGDGGDDTITCGSGMRDQAQGGAGNDVIGCRDRGRGRDIIDCGPGRDRAIVDRTDIVRNCESVSRR